MKKAVIKFLTVYLVWTVIMILQKPLFMLVYRDTIGVDGSFVGAIGSVILHGLRMDLSTAAYLTVIPALLIIAAVAGAPRRLTAIAEAIYYPLAGVVVAGIAAIDLVLYGYWGFRLDVTPFFYFFSSPEAAAASATVGDIILAALGWIAAGGVIWVCFRLTAMQISVSALSGRQRAAAVGVMTLLTAALIIPIRGGVTVSTMNLSTAYFSPNPRLNHAAVNPVFSLLYSASHQNDFASQFRYFDRSEAEAIVAGMTRRSETAVTDTTLLSTDRPDIYIIILESFSSHLLPVQGGEPVAMRLDSVARTGVLFDRFYASSFRTDRALPAILSGFPGQPTTSVMKYVSKAENLPSIPKTLARNGYDLSYYYGGDINFTNMLAYLVSSGFNRIVRDTDFPLAKRTGKWGAHDGDLFDLVAADIRTDRTDAGPKLRVIQTSSSHEPYEVPYHNPRFADNKRTNAFAYADSCLGAFLDTLARSPRYDRSLVVIVPDHFGVYPVDLPSGEERHHIPLVMTGGALRGVPRVVSRTASQTDLAATLLGLLGIDSSEFAFSNNIFDPASGHWAYFSDKDAIGLVTDNGSAYYNIEGDKAVYTKGEAASDSSVIRAKALLQLIYTSLSNL